ncbi:bll4525 hypothetical protein [Bradyrhizobium sp.]|nr:bll4525 hypothetical protein [Bradyrhizobium sp.]
MHQTSNPATLDKLKLRIQALRAKLIDGAVRAELGRFKTSVEYSRFRHQQRHLANASFALGMVASIADRLVAIKAGRDQVNESPAAGWWFSRPRRSMRSSTSST